VGVYPVTVLRIYRQEVTGRNYKGNNYTNMTIQYVIAYNEYIYIGLQS